MPKQSNGNSSTIIKPSKPTYQPIIITHSKPHLTQYGINVPGITFSPKR